MVQFSYLYTTNRETIALTIWTFVGKVMSLLFNTLSRFVIAFLPRSKCLLISWLQSLSIVILEPKKIKSTLFTSNEYLGLVSFRIDWFGLIAVQGTLKSLVDKFKSISSSVLSFLYDPTLTSIHDNWKNHSFD